MGGTGDFWFFLEVSSVGFYPAFPYTYTYARLIALAQMLCSSRNALNRGGGMNCACAGYKSVAFQEPEEPWAATQASGAETCGLNSVSAKVQDCSKLNPPFHSAIRK